MEALDIDKLYEMALADAGDFFPKLSKRMMGVKRMEKLHTYLLGRKPYMARQSFEELLLAIVENEMGVGLFAKGKGREKRES